MGADADRERALARIHELRGQLPTAAQNVAVRQAVWAACRILRGEGRSINAIANLLGLSWKTSGSSSPRRSRRPATGCGPGRPPTALSYQQIATRLGCDPRTVGRWLAVDSPPAAKGRPVRFAPRDDAA